ILMLTGGMVVCTSERAGGQAISWYRSIPSFKIDSGPRLRLKSKAIDQALLGASLWQALILLCGVQMRTTRDTAGAVCQGLWSCLRLLAVLNRVFKQNCGAKEPASNCCSNWQSRPSPTSTFGMLLEL